MLFKIPSSLIVPARHALLFSLTFGLVSAPVYAADSDDELGFVDDTVCAAPRIDLPALLLAAPAESAEDQEIGLEGDEMDIDVNDKNKVIMTGNAQVIQGRRGVFADKITYDQGNYQANVEGNVLYYTLEGDEIKTDSMRLEIDSFVGSTGPASMRLVSRKAIVKKKQRNYVEDYTPFAPILNRIVDIPAPETDERPRVENRVTANKIDIEGESFQRLHEATVTRCPYGEDVLIISDEVELDHEAGVGYAKNVTVKFKGVPVLWAPRFSFPLNNERKTGFLAPSIGDDDISGLMFTFPYYFNIADNYDATLRPTYYTNRGLQLYGEFRYLNDSGDAVLKGEFMPQDDLFEQDDRYAYGLDVKQNYDNGWGLRVDLQDVSDTSYLGDFRNDINLTSSTHLPQTLKLKYSDNLLYMRSKLSKYTAVAPDLEASNPFDRLPQIEFGIRPQDFGPFELALDSEFVSFNHDDADRLTGSRLNIKPSISMPYEPIYGYLEPKLSYRSLSYQLDNSVDGVGDSPSAAAPIFSVDSGIFFERDFSLGENAMLQTLEPRIMYVYVPEEDQNGFPDFDTGTGSVSNYNVLFREDRFFGGDRIGDDHHVALGLTTRVIDDESGKERLKASIGQVYYIDDRKVNLDQLRDDEDEESEDENTASVDSADTADKSDIFAELNAPITEELELRSFLRFDENDGNLKNITAGLDYHSGSRRSMSLDYFKNDEVSEDVRLQLNWPLTPRVQFQTDNRYSLEDEDFRANSFGLVYDACCWAVGLKATRFIHTNGEFRESILATFEMDGLGRIQTAR